MDYYTQASKGLDAHFLSSSYFLVKLYAGTQIVLRGDGGRASIGSNIRHTFIYLHHRFTLEYTLVLPQAHSPPSLAYIELLRCQHCSHHRQAVLLPWRASILCHGSAHRRHQRVAGGAAGCTNY